MKKSEIIFNIGAGSMMIAIAVSIISVPILFHKAIKEATKEIYLKEEYDELKSNYDILEKDLKWKLEECYQQLGDLQDKYEITR